MNGLTKRVRRAQSSRLRWAVDGPDVAYLVCNGRVHGHVARVYVSCARPWEGRCGVRRLGLFSRRCEAKRAVEMGWGAR